jgi:alkylation response protein AidB-like acyl-CoA dehydrogenase
MYDYKAPLRDMQFVLHEVWQAENEWAQIPAYSEVNAELAASILDEAAKITETAVAPINREGDEQGVSWSEEGVSTPDGYKQAWADYAPGGWIGLAGNPEYGGMGMPKSLSVLFEEMLHASSNAFCLYSILTTGAALAIDAHGSEEIKQRYLPRMYSGEWAGAMCLTESHAGSDLGIIRTKAEPNADGSYDITGTKIFITGGEQDLTDNIIHLVLAKLPDAPAGSRGISMFLVPKVMVNDDESLGERNAVHCASVEHKMGIHASATCVMNFDAAKGYLVGEVNKGLAAMFTMMNYERLSMGLQGLGCSDLALQKSRAYANDRVQGRSADGAKDPEGMADPIIVHADVRRMLLTQKALEEAGRAFAVYTGIQLDRSKFGDAAATDRVALLTPVAKAFMTDKAFESCVHGQQVFGGHGYIREWGMEQLVRDVRISQIYEGTNGIQAADLMGRKVVHNGGVFVESYVAEIRAFMADISDDYDLVSALENALGKLEQSTALVIERAKDNPHEVGAASVDYCNLFGLVSYAYMWLRMVEVAKAQLSQDSTGFYASKIDTACFFSQRLLPQVNSLAESIAAGADVMMHMDASSI